MLLVPVAWVRGAASNFKKPSLERGCIYSTESYPDYPREVQSEHDLFLIMKGVFASSEWRVRTEFTSNPLTKYTTYKVEAALTM